MKSNKRILFYAVTMMYWFSMYTYVPILSPYVEHLGGSIFVIGLVVGKLWVYTTSCSHSIGYLV